MRQKTSEALSDKEEQVHKNEAAALEKVVEFRKKTRRLANTRYSHLTKLIEGAAATGKSSLEYPSTWTFGTHNDENTEIFSQIAEKLRSDGFEVEVFPESKKSRIHLPPDRTYVMDHRVRLVISWKTA